MNKTCAQFFKLGVLIVYPYVDARRSYPKFLGAGGGLIR
ncbi:hypothetical protein KLEB271_gp107 [Bacillus phage vB_BauS_KLEB27-1]|nr:hypothetical protein KLEB271_gp107 [Bacillus phage vB_BauS_KLEB27-1]